MVTTSDMPFPARYRHRVRFLGNGKRRKFRHLRHSLERLVQLYSFLDVLINLNSEKSFMIFRWLEKVRKTDKTNLIKFNFNIKLTLEHFKFKLSGQKKVLNIRSYIIPSCKHKYLTNFKSLSSKWVNFTNIFSLSNAGCTPTIKNLCRKKFNFSMYAMMNNSAITVIIKNMMHDSWGIELNNIVD